MQKSKSFWATMILLAVLAVLAVIWLTGGTGKQAPATQTEAPEGAFIMAGADTYHYTRDWSTNAFFKRMEERTGVSFAFSQFYDLKSFAEWKSGLTKESADLPDVLFKACLSDDEIRTLVDRGVLIDLSAYINAETMPNLSALFAEHPEWKAACTLPDGKVYTLPMIDPLQVNNLMWVNTKWLGRVNMNKADITDADQLTKMLRAFRDEDANANGNPNDEKPLTFSGMWSLRFLLHAYGVTMNDYQLATDDANRVFTPLTTAQMREGLQWLHTLYEENLIDHTGFTTPETMRKITDDKNIPYGMILGSDVTALLQTTQLNAYEALLPLTYNGKQVYRSFLGPVTRGTFAVTSRCGDPAAVLRWADELYSEEGCYLALVGQQMIEENGQVIQDGEYSVDSNGEWRWKVAADQIESQVYAKSTIGSDLPMPGYVQPEFQRRFADETIRKQVDQLEQVSKFATEPCPQVFFTAEESARLAEIWPPLASYIEKQLTWFVTGEESLDDAGWDAFCAEIDRLGMEEIITIWQGAVDRFEEARK